MSKSHSPALVQLPESCTYQETPLSTFNHARYDGFGQLAAEYRSTAGSITPSCTICYLTTDYLGTTRMVTDSNGNVVARHDFLPFGEEVPAGYAGRNGPWGGDDSVAQKFTGQIRDAETNLDFFNARYMSAAQGRFLSPDPFNAGADPTNPQTWNAYGYVRGNPLALTDPTGMTCQPLDDGSYYDDGDGQGCDAAGVAPGDPNNSNTLNQNQVNAQTNAQQTSIWDYLWTISTNQIPDQEIDNTVVPPTSQDYIDAIQQGLSQLPNVCDVGINARAGLPGSRFAFGLDANSQKGVRFSGSARIAQLGPVTGSVSYKGPGGAPSATVNVRIPDTPLSVGASTNGQTLTSVNVGARVGRAANFQVYADIVAVGRVRNPKCQ